MKKKPILGVVLGSTTALENLFYMLSGFSDFELFIYAPKFPDSHIRELERRKIRYSDDFIFTLLNLPSLNLILTFGFLPHIAHRNIVHLCASFKDIGGKIIDIQHGLFQWGVNFSDQSLRQGYDQTKQSGISLPIKTFADVQAEWFGKNGIGFPKRNLTPKDDGFILIATNSNWHIYSHEERIKLARYIYFFVKSNPKLKFVWKPHPAEFNKNLSPILSLFDYDKLDNMKVIEHGQAGKSLTELVFSCKFGIATVGTSLLEFQLAGKEVSVYSTRAVENLLSQFDTISTFEAGDEYRNLKKCVPTFQDIPEFSPSKLNKFIQRNLVDLDYSSSLVKISSKLLMLEGTM